MDIALPNSSLLKSQQIKTQTEEKSSFQRYRSKYVPRVPKVLEGRWMQGMEQQIQISNEVSALFPNIMKEGVKAVRLQEGKQSQVISKALRVGCVLSGGQAAGGHNVIVGLFEAIKRVHPNSQLFGFLNGPRGIFKGEWKQLREQIIDSYRNRGGFDMICSGRDKIQTEEQLQRSLEYCESLKLDGLVIIGGDDSNTNAAILAEFFLSKGSTIRVIGCPKTIDGDLKNEFVQVSFGFDTACRTYSECISSVMADTLSSKKYYHFIRLMGRSASHIALQCALLTHPTYAFVGEEVRAHNISLADLVRPLVDIIKRRFQNKKNYGVVLIPQGLIEFIPQISLLIKQLNTLLHTLPPQQLISLRENVIKGLSNESREVFLVLPKEIADQLLLDRDPHGNVQVAKIQTERLVIDLVFQQLKHDVRFSPLSSYFGYEGRCAFPSGFDCDYCFSLGLTAGALIQARYTAVMACVRGLAKNSGEWVPGGYPLLTMMTLQNRKNKQIPVIQKALVDLNGPLFLYYSKIREQWGLHDSFNLIGPCQFQLPSQRPFLVAPEQLKEAEFNRNSIQSCDSPQSNNKSADLNLNRQNDLQTQFINKQIQKLPSFAQPCYRNNLMRLLKKQRSEYPIQLDESLTAVLSETMDHASLEVREVVKRDWPLISVDNNHLITFAEGGQPKKTKIGVCFMGRQSPGGHNIVQGLLSEHTQVIGFLEGNTGLFHQKWIVLNKNLVDHFVNESGFHMLGRNSDRLRKQRDLQQATATCIQLKLDGLILIGASHTLTDCLILAQHLRHKGVATVVNAVPCTIDNNVAHQQLQLTVGHSSSSHAYSTLISNLMTDAASNTKYWFFIRLMGRDPSHLTLQCALATHPNYTVISEEVKSKGWDLEEIVDDIVRVVLKRNKAGLHFGCVLVPEGLPAFLSSIMRIKTEMDQINSTDEEVLRAKMSEWAWRKFQMLPDFLRKQMFLRDESNELALSKMETQRLLSHLVGQKLKTIKEFKGSFSSVCHFFGYQGRCVTPSKLDRSLGLTYGKIARVLVECGVTGYCTSARNLTASPSEWLPLAIPITYMCVLRPKSKIFKYRQIWNEQGSCGIGQSQFEDEGVQILQGTQGAMGNQ